MASTTYAAIHVGSNELCMKIYEMSRQNGIRQLTYVRHPLSLGAESYTEGVISYQTLTEICNTLNDFKRIMTEFHTDSWDVCATSAMREAKNVLVVTDQIKIQTGFKVKLFSNSEARFLYFTMKTNLNHSAKKGVSFSISAPAVSSSLFFRTDICS